MGINDVAPIRSSLADCLLPFTRMIPGSRLTVGGKENLPMLRSAPLFQAVQDRLGVDPHGGLALEFSPDEGLMGERLRGRQPLQLPVSD